MDRRSFVIGTAAAATGLAAAPGLAQQPYPSHPITFIFYIVVCRGRVLFPADNRIHPTECGAWGDDLIHWTRPDGGPAIVQKIFG